MNRFEKNESRYLLNLVNLFVFASLAWKNFYQFLISICKKRLENDLINREKRRVEKANNQKDDGSKRDFIKLHWKYSPYFRSLKELDDLEPYTFNEMTQKCMYILTTLLYPHIRVNAIDGLGRCFSTLSALTRTEEYTVSGNIMSDPFLEFKNYPWYGKNFFPVLSRAGRIRVHSPSVGESGYRMEFASAAITKSKAVQDANAQIRTSNAIEWLSGMFSLLIFAFILFLFICWLNIYFYPESLEQLRGKRALTRGRGRGYSLQSAFQWNVSSLRDGGLADDLVTEHHAYYVERYLDQGCYIRITEENRSAIMTESKKFFKFDDSLFTNLGKIIQDPLELTYTTSGRNGQAGKLQLWSRYCMKYPIDKKTDLPLGRKDDTKLVPICLYCPGYTFDEFAVWYMNMYAHVAGLLFNSNHSYHLNNADKSFPSRTTGLVCCGLLSTNYFMKNFQEKRGWGDIPEALQHIIYLVRFFIASLTSPIQGQMEPFDLSALAYTFVTCGGSSKLEESGSKSSHANLIFNKKGYLRCPLYFAFYEERIIPKSQVSLFLHRKWIFIFSLTII